MRFMNFLHFRTLFKLRKPLHTNISTTNLIFLNSLQPTLYSSFFRRTISFSAQFKPKLYTKSIESENARGTGNKTKKSLGHVFLKEAVGLSEKVEQSESEFESQNEGEAKELKKKLKELEKKVCSLKENKLKGIENNNEKEGDNLSKKKIKLDDGVLKDKLPGSLSALFVKDRSGYSGEKSFKNKVDNGVSKDDSRPGSLSALFSNKPADRSGTSSKRTRSEEPIVYKELPPNMVEFARYLYEQGYFRDANFLPMNKFDAACFENNYGRDFLKHAAQKFGRDHQEIAKWLSGSELKKVALFGCPSLSKKTVFSAKTLRTFFKIPENTVCCKCVLKQSCKFVNQSVWKGNTKNLDLPVVMNVITLYALESVPPQLVVPNEIKTSVARLLEEVVKLSQTVS